MTDANRIAIESEGLRAQIDAFGAQLFCLRDKHGHDLLWSGDPAVWASRAPILFPIVGALRDGQYHIGERVFALPRHGFARHRPFAVLDATKSSVTFGLRADAETLAVYPFRFELDIRFALAADTLQMRAEIRNVGDEIMPASFGFHPAFRWPLPYGADRAAHVIQFERDEPLAIRKLDAAGLIRPDPMPTPVVGRVLRLRDELFADDALVFDRLASRSLRYGSLRGAALEIAFPDTPMLGIWSKPGAGFVAIEPWHGIADPQGFTGSLDEKPGIFLVAPGAAKICTMTVTLRRAAGPAAAKTEAEPAAAKTEAKTAAAKTEAKTAAAKTEA